MGHSLELRGYRKRIGLEESGECRRCGEEDETVEHVILRCPAAVYKRAQYGIGKLSHLCSRPMRGLDFWKWFRGTQPRPPE
jgi:hypothetical protein